MDSEFHRIRRLPPYVFSEVNAVKAKARAAGNAELAGQRRRAVGA